MYVCIFICKIVCVRIYDKLLNASVSRLDMDMRAGLKGKASGFEHEEKIVRSWF